MRKLVLLEKAGYPPVLDSGMALLSLINNIQLSLNILQLICLIRDSMYMCATNYRQIGAYYLDIHRSLSGQVQTTISDISKVGYK